MDGWDTWTATSNRIGVYIIPSGHRRAKLIMSSCENKAGSLPDQSWAVREAQALAALVELCERTTQESLHVIIFKSGIAAYVT